MQPRTRITTRGFTLIELLFTVSIIALLSTIGVTQYESARRQSRDVKRTSDIQQIRSALELYFETNGYYPSDARPGIDPELLVAEGETLSLSDAGFSTEPRGRVYMSPIPRNPSPGGSPYAYRSIQRNGTDCVFGKCEAYALLFTLEGAMGSYGPGSHALTPEGVVGGGVAQTGVTTAGGEVVGLEFAQEVVQQYLAEIGEGAATVLDDPTVEAVAEVGVAPAAAGLAIVNTGLAAQATSFGAQYILYFLSQPFLLLRRRRRAQWGVVYNTLTRLPVDLAIVRLVDDARGTIVRSEVTDAKGRFAFLISRPGRYRIEVVRKDIVFPSKLVHGMAEDREFDALYHGDAFDVGTEGAFVHPNVPVDPSEHDEDDILLIRENATRQRRSRVALVSPALGALTLLVKPSLFVLLLFAAQVVAYALFRRIAVPYTPKSWGVVHDDASKKPVLQAVLRIFEGKYNKLLETQVTDARGRYSFRVGGNVYYLTVTKPGYYKTESEKMDLTEREGATVIAQDLPLRKIGGIDVTAVDGEEVPPPAPEAKPSVLVPPQGR